MLIKVNVMRCEFVVIFYYFSFMVMTKHVGTPFLFLCFKCFCKDKSSHALMKFCWAPEMAREMRRRGVSLRTSKGRKDYRFLQKVFIYVLFCGLP